MRVHLKKGNECCHSFISSKFINAARIGEFLRDSQRALEARIRAHIRARIRARIRGRSIADGDFVPCGVRTKNRHGGHTSAVLHPHNQGGSNAR